ncbi:hypothetical protein HDR62_00270 [bacterium]|nr:hypothetical protein [bacterium]
MMEKKENIILFTPDLTSHKVKEMSVLGGGARLRLGCRAIGRNNTSLYTL